MLTRSWFCVHRCRREQGNYKPRSHCSVTSVCWRSHRCCWVVTKTWS